MEGCDNRLPRTVYEERIGELLHRELPLYVCGSVQGRTIYEIQKRRIPARSSRLCDESEEDTGHREDRQGPGNDIGCHGGVSYSMQHEA
eukprot:7132302-Karenia_brevis.AAC.1